MISNRFYPVKQEPFIIIKLIQFKTNKRFLTQIKLYPLFLLIVKIHTIIKILALSITKLDYPKAIVQTLFPKKR